MRVTLMDTEGTFGHGPNLAAPTYSLRWNPTLIGARRVSVDAA
jgi:hypothetical protein